MNTKLYAKIGSRVSATFVNGGESVAEVKNGDKITAIVSESTGNIFVEVGNDIQVKTISEKNSNQVFKLNLPVGHIEKRKPNLWDIFIMRPNILTKMYPRMVFGNVAYLIEKYLINIYVEDYACDKIYYVLRSTGELEWEKLHRQLMKFGNFIEEIELSPICIALVFKIDTEQRKQLLKNIVEGNFSKLPKEEFYRFLGKLKSGVNYDYWKHIYEKSDDMRKALSLKLGIEITSDQELHSKPAPEDVIWSMEYVTSFVKKSKLPEVSPKEAFDD